MSVITRIRRVAEDGFGLTRPATERRRAAAAAAPVVEDDGPKLFLFIFATMCFLVAIILHMTTPPTGPVDDQSLSYKVANASRAL